MVVRYKFTLTSICAPLKSVNVIAVVFSYGCHKIPISGMVPCCGATGNRHKRGNSARFYVGVFTFLNKTTAHKWLTPCSEGGITSGRMGASVCRGEKELSQITLLLTGKEFQLQWKGREAACRDCTIPWQEAGAPGVTGNTFLTATLRASSEHKWALHPSVGQKEKLWF